MSRRMLASIFLAVTATLAAWAAIAQAQGMGLPPQLQQSRASLPEDKTTRITCTHEGKTYHYDLYIPKGYYADENNLFPVIFIASTGGNASMGNAADWIRDQRWLAVMLVEAQNGPAEPNNENFLCAHDDVIQRVRIHENMKFATGVSGAARMSARFVTFRPGFRGLILQAAGMCSDYGFCGSIEWFLASKPNLNTFATFGDSDFNLWELGHLSATIPEERFNSEVFSGGHEAAPVETMNRAFAWLMDNISEDEYAIFGRITVTDSVVDAAELLSGVTIAANSGSSVTTGELLWPGRDQDGGYYFADYILSVMGAGAHEVTASKEGYLFTPNLRTVSLPPETWDQDFEMRVNYDISGRVLDCNGNPFAGVQISTSPEYTTTTSADGQYTIQAVPVGTYTLTPTSPGHSFQPLTRDIKLPPDAVGQDFTGLAAPVSTTVQMLGAASPAFSLTYTDTQGLRTTLRFLAGAVTQTALARADSAPSAEDLSVVVTPTLAMGGAGLAFAGHSFDLAVYLDGHLQPGLTFSKPVIATIHYSTVDVLTVSDKKRLALWHWTSGKWENAADTCTPAWPYLRDLDNHVISAAFCQVDRYALLGPTNPVFLPLVLR